MTKLGKAKRLSVIHSELAVAMDACEYETRSCYDTITLRVPWVQSTEGSSREIRRYLDD